MICMCREFPEYLATGFNCIQIIFFIIYFFLFFIFYLGRTQTDGRIAAARASAYAGRNHGNSIFSTSPDPCTRNQDVFLSFSSFLLQLEASFLRDRLRMDLEGLVRTTRGRFSKMNFPTYCTVAFFCHTLNFYFTSIAFNVRLWSYETVITCIYSWQPWNCL